MNTKTIPLSVRVSAEDAEFISRMEVVGATTPSDKLRAIISDARMRAEGENDYASCLQNIGDMAGPAFLQLKQVEHEQRLHSELLERVNQWIPETLAFIVSELHKAKKQDSKEQLEELENGVGDRVFRLIEAILRMGVTKHSNCYRSEAVSARLEPVLELANVILATKK